MEIKEILEKEPLLLDIFSEAKAVEGAYWERNDFWYRKLKPKMLKLVGFNAENEELRTTGIYDKVYFYCMGLMSL
jgi:hypothetical protein